MIIVYTYYLEFLYLHHVHKKYTKLKNNIPWYRLDKNINILTNRSLDLNPMSCPIGGLKSQQ